MVYFGFGVFYCVYQGVYIDILVVEQYSDWGYYEVNFIGGEQQIVDLKQQDNFYIVVEMLVEVWMVCVVGVVKVVLYVQVDGLECVLVVMCEL